MATYRERRVARAERLKDWAGAREQKAAVEYEASHAATAGIPFGQPILVGHHSEKRHRRAIERGDAAMRRSSESAEKARDMAQRAANIEAQNRAAIYSDDENAIEMLRARIAKREAKRDEMKAANAAFRKDNAAILKGRTAYEKQCAVPFPAYALTNLGATIRTDKKRLAQLEHEAVNGKPAARDRIICARFASECTECGAQIERGDTIRYNRDAGARCQTCPITTEETDMDTQAKVAQTVERMRQADTEFITAETVAQFAGVTPGEAAAGLAEMGYTPEQIGEVA